jgi:hypothetical protein
MNPLKALEAARQALIGGKKAYRALRQASKARPDELYPAMIKDVKGKQFIEPGREYPAEYFPEKAAAAGIAPRYGWHSGEVPYARQFDVKVGPEDIEQLGLDPSALGQKLIQPDTMVWTEVDIPEGYDYTKFVESVEDSLGRNAKPEELADIAGALVPESGFYRYNPSNKGKRGGDPWIISDRITHTRLLSDDEVDEILLEMGRKDLTNHPRRGGRWTEERLREAFPGWFAAGAAPATLFAGLTEPMDETEAANIAKLQARMRPSNPMTPQEEAEMLRQLEAVR